MKKSPSPEVSVIVPCYNMGDYIAETIDSVLAQTFQNYEIIIVDDASDDGTTPKVIDEQVKKDPRISVISLKENVKLPNARNIGIAKAKAPYILPLDSDDMIASSYLQKAVPLIKKENGDILSSHTQVFGESNRINRVPPNPKKILPFRNCLPACSFFTKSAWEELGGYNDNMNLGYEDWDFWLCFVEADKKFVRLKEILLYYRVRPVSMITESVKYDAELFRQIKRNHPSLYRLHNYYFAREFWIPYIRAIRTFRRRAFQIRFYKGQKIIRLFGVTFLNRN